MKVDKTSIRPHWMGPKMEAFTKDEWRTRLYNSPRWRRMAKAEINTEPYCVECAANGVSTTDSLQRDHVNGFSNEQEFWEGARQTLCKRHNMQKAGKWGGKKSKGGAYLIP